MLRARYLQGPEKFPTKFHIIRGVLSAIVRRVQCVFCIMRSKAFIITI